MTETGLITVARPVTAGVAMTATEAVTAAGAVTGTVPVTATGAMTPTEGAGSVPTTLPLTGFSGLGMGVRSLAAALLVLLGLIGVEVGRKNAKRKT
jgi:hypothetical protein